MHSAVDAHFPDASQILGFTRVISVKTKPTSQIIKVWTEKDVKDGDELDAYFFRCVVKLAVGFPQSNTLFDIICPLTYLLVSSFI